MAHIELETIGDLNSILSKEETVVSDGIMERVVLGCENSQAAKVA